MREAGSRENLEEGFPEMKAWSRKKTADVKMVCSGQCFSKSNERIRPGGCKQANMPESGPQASWTKESFLPKGCRLDHHSMFFL